MTVSRLRHCAHAEHVPTWNCREALLASRRIKEAAARSSVSVDGVAEGGAIALSVVAPCFNEQSCLPEFHRRTTAACRCVCGDAYEIVLVDDASPDDTWQIIQSLSQADPRVIGVHLMRNHGHQLAATAGLCIARGQRVMLIDADLRTRPSSSRMMRSMDESADVVYGRRTAREGETWF